MTESADSCKGTPLRSQTSGTTVSLLQAAARWMVVGATVVAPWLFGSTEPWAVYVISIAVFVGAMFWLVSVAAKGQAEYAAPALSLVLLLGLLYICFQAAPLPPAIVSLVSPLSAETLSQSADLLRQVDGGPATAGQTVSMCPRATMASAYYVGICVAAFLVMLNCARHWYDLRRAAAVLLAFGFVLTVVSLIHNLSGTKALLWFHTPSHMVHGFGPFSNRNHFACHITLILAVGMGLLLAEAGSSERPGSRFPYGKRTVFTSFDNLSRLAMIAFAVLLSAATVFITLSRGAILSLVVTLVIASIYVAFSEHGARRTPLVVAGVLLLLAVVGWLGWDPVVARLGTLAGSDRDPALGFRSMAATDTFLLFGLSPLLGSGFGAFQYAFPLVSRPELHFGRWVHAHNDWIEWAAEGGVVGMFLIALAIMMFVDAIRRGLPAVRTERRRFAQGCLLGIIAVAFHGIVDFSLRKPANGLLFAVLAGMTVAACRPYLAAQTAALSGRGESQGRSANMLLSQPRGFTRVRLLACAGLVVLILAMGSGAKCFSESLAFQRFEYQARLYDKIRTPALKAPLIASAREDALIAARNGSCHPYRIPEMLLVYSRWIADRDIPRDIRRQIEDETVVLSTAMVQAAPSDCVGWLWLARAEAFVGQWDLADLCMERARQLRPRGQTPLLLSGAR